MNKKFFTIILVAVLAFSVNSQASFPIKPKQHTETKTENIAATENNATATETTTAATSNESKHAEKKHNLISRLFHKIKEGKDVLPQALYIVLCILPLGWLAMGLNDNFTGKDWVISLVLYLLIYLPGLIYSLIMMGKYY